MRYVLLMACAISLLAFIPLTKCNEHVLQRYIDADLGEFARIVEDQGSRYLALNGNVYVPSDRCPPLGIRYRLDVANDDERRSLREEDFPVLVWYGVECAYERVWRVSDGRLLLDRQ